MPDDLRTSVAADLGSLASELVAVAATTPPPLAAGTIVAEHFVIEELIGRGGMGTVYRARDTRLGRAVAIKLGLGAAAQREARALAKLAHPNVVAIYEVGDGAQPFVAMELVTGATARHWLAAAPRSWREIVGLYAAVGRGLAAAHAAGLVHRDVKPENILVGDDGRPRIADFGLASEPGGGVAVGSSPGGAPPRVAGTPRYMAPEQRAGIAIDARADQFALAVALYEALAGIDPFSTLDRDAAISAGKLRAGRRMPRRIHAVLARALAFDRDRRWPATSAFVAALERALRPRWPWVAGAAAIAVLGSAWALARPHEAPVVAATQPVLCAALSPELDAMWTPHARGELIANNAQATSTAAWLADVIDYQARAWPGLQAKVCRDGVHDRAWAPALLDDAARCLVERRAELARALDTRHATAGELFAAGRSIHDAHVCADPIAMTRMARRPTGLDRIKLDEVEQLTGQADAANAAGDTAVAKARSEEALALAIPSGVALARAEALETIGEIELARHDVGPAAEHLQAAYFEYRTLSDQAQTYRTALMVTQLLAADGKLERAQEWLEHARAEAERTGATPEKRAAVDLVGAQLLAADHKLDAAIAMIDRDLPRLRDEPDPRFLTDTINALGNKAMFQGMANHPGDALATGRAALALQERVYGPDHPELLAVLETIGLAERDLGQLDGALATLGRANTIATTHLARTSPLRLGITIDYALVLAKRDPAKARPVLLEARTDGAKTLDAATLAEVDQALR